MLAQQTAQTLSTVAAIFWVLVGILISLILPIAIKILKPDRTIAAQSAIGQKITTAWQQYSGTKYLVKFLAAVFVAIVLVLLLGLEFSTIRDAVLAGFAWESLLNKLMGQS